MSPILSRLKIIDESEYKGLLNTDMLRNTVIDESGQLYARIIPIFSKSNLKRFNIDEVTFFG
ncbi:MAG: hypothetical protein P9M13_04885 [Candidatus Ancaeobacter aquaticus]|nr:hypothetical protein [Candidatus Ancaeobacter aquaticus]